MGNEAERNLIFGKSDNEPPQHCIGDTNENHVISPLLFISR
jgi:hypothetical protein